MGLVRTVTPQTVHSNGDTKAAVDMIQSKAKQSEAKHSNKDKAWARCVYRLSKRSNQVRSDQTRSGQPITRLTYLMGHKQNAQRSVSREALGKAKIPPRATKCTNEM